MGGRSKTCLECQDFCPCIFWTQIFQSKYEPPGNSAADLFRMVEWPFESLSGLQRLEIKRSRLESPGIDSAQKSVIGIRVAFFKEMVQIRQNLVQAMNFMGFSEKTHVLVRVYNQQFQGAILWMGFDYQGGNHWSFFILSFKWTSLPFNKKWFRSYEILLFVYWTRAFFLITLIAGLIFDLDISTITWNTYTKQKPNPNSLRHN